MSNVAPAAIMVASFVLAIGLVRVLDRMIDRDTDPGMADARALARPRLGSAPLRGSRPHYKAPGRAGSKRRGIDPDVPDPERREHVLERPGHQGAPTAAIEPIVSSSDASVVNARPSTLASPQPPGLQGKVSRSCSPAPGPKTCLPSGPPVLEPNSLRSTADAAAGIARGGAASAIYS